MNNTREPRKPSLASQRKANRRRQRALRGPLIPKTFIVYVGAPVAVIVVLWLFDPGSTLGWHTSLNNFIGNLF